MPRSSVLIAEDVRPMRIVLERMVSSLGVETIAAADGEEALSLYARHQPAIALLDVAMPGIDGIEVCRRIQLADHDAIVAMLTASSNERTVRQAMEAGAVDFIAKPVTVERLEETLRRLVPSLFS